MFCEANEIERANIIERGLSFRACPQISKNSVLHSAVKGVFEGAHRNENGQKQKHAAKESKALGSRWTRAGAGPTAGYEPIGETTDASGRSE
ncbi:MAG: hypothetical protein DMF14_16745 [Verrucomicrobia bacterium]|nr:MAG: hypothetical protein DMF14_16745 [Verrucomicrobiota bacterium]